MYLAGFSINVLSMLAIVLSVGLVVDDAIVMTENIYIRIVNMVCTRLWNYYHADHGYAVHLHVALDVGWPQLGTSDVTETYNSVVLLLDNQVIEFICRVHQS